MKNKGIKIMSLNKNEIVKNLKSFLLESRNGLGKFWISGKVLELIRGGRIVGSIDYISLYVDKSTFSLLSNDINHTVNLSGDKILWLDVNDYPIKLFCEEEGMEVIGKKCRVLSVSLDNIDSLFVKSYQSIPIV